MRRIEVILFYIVYCLLFTFTLSQDKPDNCQTLAQNPALGCEKCNPGFYTTPKKDGSGYIICSKCSDTLKNCNTCASSKVCTSCYNGNYLYADVCKPCIKGCKNCFEKDNCVTCNSGFRLNNGICVHKWKQMILDVVIWMIVLVPISMFVGIWLFYTIKNKRKGEQLNEKEVSNSATDKILVDIE